MSKVDAIKFVMQCQNWYEVAFPIAAHKTPARVILKDGTRFDSHSVYWADMYAIFFLRIYTPRYLAIEREDIVVDIGANIGVFTVYAALKTHNTVYAVEPSPDNYRAMEQNIHANNLKNVIPLRFAVSDTNGSELFFNSGASQHHRLKKVLRDEIDQCIEVPSMSLQALMDRYQLERVDFLKLDCEGAEETILHSTPDAYLQRVRKIALEFHDHLTLDSHEALQHFLETVGFSTKVDWDEESVLGFIYAWRE